MAYTIEQDPKTGIWSMRNGKKVVLTYKPQPKEAGDLCIKDGYCDVYTTAFSVGLPDSEQLWKNRTLQFFDLACQYDANNDNPAMEQTYSDLVNTLAQELHPWLENKHEETPLHIAAKWGRVDAMKAQLKRGADIRAMTRQYKSANDYLDQYVNKTLLGIATPKRNYISNFFNKLMLRKKSQAKSSLRVNLQTMEHDKQQREAWKTDKTITNAQRASLFLINHMREPD